MAPRTEALFCLVLGAGELSEGRMPTWACEHGQVCGSGFLFTQGQFAFRPEAKGGREITLLADVHLLSKSFHELDKGLACGRPAGRHAWPPLVITFPTFHFACQFPLLGM